MFCLFQVLVSQALRQTPALGCQSLARIEISQSHMFPVRPSEGRKRKEKKKDPSFQFSPDLENNNSL